MTSAIQRLHLAISQVAPINGVSSDGFIGFTAEATPQQQQAAQAIWNSWNNDLEEAKDSKLTLLDAWYENAQQFITIEYNNETFVFLGTDQGQNYIANATTGLREAQMKAESQGVPTAAFEAQMVSSLLGRKLTTTSGEKKDVTVSQYRDLALLYMPTVGGLQGQYLQLKENILSAATEAELDAISIG